MVCCSCGKPIEAGEYRWREKADAYVTQHRACSPDAPEWRSLDANRKAQSGHNERLLAAAVAFRARWSVDDLDDLIEGLTPSNGDGNV
jgi:hypothetical protein